MTKTPHKYSCIRHGAVYKFTAAVACCLIGGFAFWQPAMAAPELPAEIKAFIERQQECDHWTGEEPYDQERRQEIEAAIDDLKCATIDKDEQALRQRYKDDKAVIKALDDSAQAPL